MKGKTCKAELKCFSQSQIQPRATDSQRSSRHINKTSKAGESTRQGQLKSTEPAIYINGSLVLSHYI